MQSHQMRRSVRARLIVALSASIGASRALGGTYFFTNAAGGNWATTSNWTSSIIPGSSAGSSGDYAELGYSTSSTAATIMLNYAYGAATNSTTSSTSLLYELDIVDNSSTQAISLVQSAATSAMSTSFETVGNNGNVSPPVATYNQSGGTNMASNYLAVGSSSPGTYLLSGGSINAGTAAVSSEYPAEYVGYASFSGPAIFQQSGGSNTVGSAAFFAAGQAYDLDVAYYTGIVGEPASSGMGTYTLAGSSSTLTVYGSEYIGYGRPASSGATTAVGIFNQSSGTNTISYSLLLGYEAAGIGTYTLSGGNLNVGSYCYVGCSGTGTFNQSAGTQQVTGALILGNLSGSFGVYTLSGGNLNVSQGSFVGGYGTGTFNQSGGTHLAADGLYVAAETGSVGSYILSGGLLQASAEQFGVEEILNSGTPVYYPGGSASFVQTGGTNNVSGSALAGSSFQIWDGAIYTLSGGTLNLPAAAGAAQNSGAFTMTGYSLETGTLLNSGTFNYQGGSFNGRLINQGSLNFTNVFTAGNGMENDGSLYLSGTQTLVMNGAGLDNLGTISLAGATISGTGPFTNDVGGTLDGYGTIYSALTNNGTISMSGTLRLSSTTTTVNNGIITGYGTIVGTLNNLGSVSVVPGEQLAISSSWTNNGLVTLGGSTAILSGGTIINNRTIQGAGTINSAINNSTGVIRASGGELDLGGTITSGSATQTGGQIEAATGTTVLFIQGLANNYGTIALAGGTVDNNNQPLINNNSIVGNGTLRTGGLTNANGGEILLTDVNSSIYGTVINAAGANIKIVSNTTTFYGNVNNSAGTIKVTSGVARFLGNGISLTVGGTYNSDPSDNYFSGLSVVLGGTVLGGNGDRFFLTDSSPLTNAGTWNVTGTLSAATVSNSGSFTQTGTLVETGNFTNTGTAVIGGTQNWSSGTTFTNSAGTALFQSDAGIAAGLPAANLSVNVSGGAVTFASTQHLVALNLSAGSSVQITGGGNGHRSVVFTPSLSDSGTLDLTGNDLDVQAGGSAAVSIITALVRQGYANGNWTGRGITSSSAAGNTNHLTAVGVILNYANGSSPIYTSLDGASVALNDVLVKYTYYGDANLDGKVDGSDYSLIDNGYLNQLTGWFNGDFNYDGVVNGSDYTLIDNAFNNQGAQLTADIAGRAAIATSEISGETSAVPEPASLAALVVGGVGLLGRRVYRMG